MQTGASTLSRCLGKQPLAAVKESEDGNDSVCHPDEALFSTSSIDMGAMQGLSSVVVH